MQDGHDMALQILNPLTMEFVIQNWLKFISQRSPEIHYPPRYLIPQFPPDRTMVNVLLHRCCATQINLRPDIGTSGVWKRVY